jgi:pyruvate,water dikinase
MNLVIRSSEDARPDDLGAKGWSLASAERAGIPVPPWFAVSPHACSGDLAISPALAAELRAALAQLCPRGERVAVRSSAVDEDGEQLSFAGQLESYLFVAPEEVADRVADVWRSAFAPRARAYREQLRGGAGAAAPAVLVQRMVGADVAGVAFSADPVSGRRAVAVVAAAPGVGTAVVSGERDADTFHVERSGRILSRSLAGARPSLSDAQALEIAALARRCARHFGRPQDVEWAIEEGRTWLLQSRPITSLHAAPDPEGELAIWDSSNIAESYGGVTTPLTFSFIRRCYEHVYRELGRLGGVAEQAIRANDDAYRRMLGFMQGRVYYNLLAWYRLLALAPGFRYNRRFLDEMLGVSAHLDASRLPKPAYTGVRDGAALARQAWRALVHHFTVERINARFRARLERALALGETGLEELGPDELAAHFRTLERQLLANWDGPLINDFFAMIFHGVLRRLVDRWLAPGDAGLDNHLLSGEGGIISVEPVRRMQEMARAVAAQPGLGELLREGTREAALAGVRRAPQAQRSWNSSWAVGTRCRGGARRCGTRCGCTTISA